MWSLTVFTLEFRSQGVDRAVHIPLELDNWWSPVFLGFTAASITPVWGSRPSHGLFPMCLLTGTTAIGFLATLISMT